MVLGTSVNSGWRPEAGFAGREARDEVSGNCAEGGGSWGNHGFPHAIESCLQRRWAAYLPIRSFQGLRGAEQIPVGQVIPVMEEEGS